MKIAVWYHCVLSGTRIPSENNAIAILSEQMSSLKRSGLADAAHEIHIGINGSDSDALTVCAFAPERSVLHISPNGDTELPTMNAMRNWLKPGWAVLYHHIKGVQHPANHSFHNWRRGMERVCVFEWQACVSALDRYDTVGSRWHTPYPTQRYWPGNFWWARSEYLMGLAPLVDPQYHNRTEWDNRYEAEVWIGKCNGQPKILDLNPHLQF